MIPGIDSGQLPTDRDRLGAACRDSLIRSNRLHAGQRGSVLQVSRFTGQKFISPLYLMRPGPLYVNHERKQGTGTGKLFRSWPISMCVPASGKPAMEFTDRVLKCIDCGAEFVFTAGEQVFFHDKQFKNDPKHCKQCKAKRVRGSQGFARRPGPRVRSAARRPPFPSSPPRAGRCCAAPAFRSTASSSRPRAQSLAQRLS